MDGRLFSESEIVTNKKEYCRFSCIYFLIRNKKIVYVGQSKHGLKRVYEHNDKEFDNYSYIVTNYKNLDQLETEYIIKFNPIYNKGVPALPERLVSYARIFKKYNITNGVFKVLQELYGLTPVYKKCYKKEEIEKYIQDALQKGILKTPTREGDRIKKVSSFKIKKMVEENGEKH